MFFAFTFSHLFLYFVTFSSIYHFSQAYNIFRYNQDIDSVNSNDKFYNIILRLWGHLGNLSKMANSNMISVLSANCRGLRGYAKRRDLFDYF